MSELTPSDLALARSRLYGLLGRLLLDGFSGEALQAARALPALAEALPDVDEDHLAARHHRAFGLGVPPYEGVLAGADAKMGGERAAAARETLAETGLREPRSDVEPDHLGLLLRAVGFCCAAEADARRDGAAAALVRTRELQRQLLDEHLLRAWPPFTVAVQGLDLSEWTAVVGLAGELLAGHRADLPGDAPIPEPPEGPDLLDDPKTGVKRILAWLLIADNAGFWLTRGDMDALSRAADVPRGFGDRFAMLESLVFGAIDHGRLDQVMDALLDITARWRRAYDGLEAQGMPVAAWTARLERGRDVIARVRAGG